MKFWVVVLCSAVALFESVPLASPDGARGASYRGTASGELKPFPHVGKDGDRLYCHGATDSANGAFEVWFYNPRKAPICVERI